MTAFLAGLLTSAVTAWPIYRFLLAIRSRQTVSVHVKEHAHKQGTPTMGGLLVLAGLAGVLGLFASNGRTSLALGLTVFLSLLAFVGFVDDFLIPRLMPGKRGLGWIPKLAMQFGTTAIGLWTLGFYPGSTFAIALLAVIFYANAFNFADGLDWLSGTILISFMIGVLLIGGSYGIQGDLALGLLGSMIPFMVLNRPKAKIFMGDVGSMPLGGLLGLFVLCLALPEIRQLLVGNTLELATMRPEQHPYRWLALLILSFVMFAELLPPPLQILSVKLTGKRIFPMTPIHHAFQKAGWPETRVVALFSGVQLLCSLVAWGVDGIR
ncbi:hypothetical protein EON79_00185 [bacterium]|nr:MAG: hypothetical protein EON79_00185 [bacterium]